MPVAVGAHKSNSFLGISPSLSPSPRARVRAFGKRGPAVVTSTNGAAHVLILDFTTGHTPGSLVGFTGGTIFQGSVFDALVQEEAYIDLNGSITAPASVPDGGTTVMLLGAALGALGMARFLKLSSSKKFHSNKSGRPF